jgi:hypothetical protein
LRAAPCTTPGRARRREVEAAGVPVDVETDLSDLHDELDRRARERRRRRGGRLPGPGRRVVYGAFSEVRHLSVAPAGRLLIGVCAGIALVTVAGLVRSRSRWDR